MSFLCLVRESRAECKIQVSFYIKPILEQNTIMWQTLTFRRHWTERRSPAGWAGNWVAERRTWAELQSVALKTKSSMMFLIPASVQRERERSKQGGKSQCNTHNCPTSHTIACWTTQRVLWGLHEQYCSWELNWLLIWRQSGLEYDACCNNVFTCSFPHSRHLKQPTQSMILEMLRKASLMSSWD